MKNKSKGFSGQMNDIEHRQWGSDTDEGLENENTGALVQNVGENCC